MIKEGSLYRHFKGNIYKVLFIAIDSETNNEIVIYEDIKTSKKWAREKRMFESKVDKEKYPNATSEYRFELIND